jgi:hypothetical protein
MTKQISLTQGQIALVDDWHYEELNHSNWRARWNKKTKSYYAVRSEGRREIQMHRVVARTPKGMLCDHRNHNTLDNQEHNLRNATNSQNNMNARLRSNNKLGERNISEHYGGFMVRVYRDKRVMFRKTFCTLDEAITARDAAIKEIHGEYAYLDDQEQNSQDITNSQKRMSRRVRPDNRLGQACISPRRAGFRVQLVRNRQRVFDKTFQKLDDAIEARDEALKLFKGKYAYKANL